MACVRTIGVCSLTPWGFARVCTVRIAFDLFQFCWVFWVKWVERQGSPLPELGAAAPSLALGSLKNSTLSSHFTNGSELHFQGQYFQSPKMRLARQPASSLVL